jgi:hypothetical protein
LPVNIACFPVNSVAAGRALAAIGDGLKLHPFWDPLRGDPRFEQIVALHAPK